MIKSECKCVPASRSTSRTRIHGEHTIYKLSGSIMHSLLLVLGLYTLFPSVLAQNEAVGNGLPPGLGIVSPVAPNLIFKPFDAVADLLPNEAEARVAPMGYCSGSTNQSKDGETNDSSTAAAYTAFGDANTLWSTDSTFRRPRWIVLPNSTDDVSAAMTWASENNLTAVARSGGHDCE